VFAVSRTPVPWARACSSLNGTLLMDRVTVRAPRMMNVLMENTKVMLFPSDVRMTSRTGRPNGRMPVVPACWKNLKVRMDSFPAGPCHAEPWLGNSKEVG
jgi:hypothetical protein